LPGTPRRIPRRCKLLRIPPAWPQSWTAFVASLLPRSASFFFFFRPRAFVTQLSRNCPRHRWPSPEQKRASSSPDPNRGSHRLSRSHSRIPKSFEAPIKDPQSLSRSQSRAPTSFEVPI
jgi:hypothetical protein